MVRSQAQGQDGAHPPEGGWGWVVVGALFVESALVFGLIRSLGVFFVEFVRYFDESAQAVSWITSIGLAMQQLFGPLATALSNMYGTRPVVMVGGFLSGLGLILASQATSLTHLYLTMGFISGVGWAFVFMPTLASVMQYFTRRRLLALSVGFTGVGFSSFAFSPLFQLLVEVYAWQGALLILGGLSLNMVACGAVLRPITATKAVDKTLKDSSCSTLLSHVSVYFELPLLRQRPFLTYSLAVTFFNAGYFVPYAHLVAHSRHAGFSEYQAALVISTTGVTDIVGRLLSSWVSDRAHLRLVHMLSLWALLLGVFLLAVPLGTLGGYAGLLTVSLAQGLCAGAMTPLVFAVMPEIAGMERILGALGLLQFLQSVGGLLGAPLSGWLKDRTGSYSASFVVAGGFLLLGSAVTATLPGFCSSTSPNTPSNAEGALQSDEGALQSEEGALQSDEGALQSDEGVLQLNKGALQSN